MVHSHLNKSFMSFWETPCKAQNHLKIKWGIGTLALNIEESKTVKQMSPSLRVHADISPVPVSASPCRHQSIPVSASPCWTSALSQSLRVQADISPVPVSVSSCWHQPCPSLCESMRTSALLLQPFCFIVHIDPWALRVRIWYLHLIQGWMIQGSSLSLHCPVLPLTKKLFATAICWERGKKYQSSPKEWHKVC